LYLFRSFHLFSTKPEIHYRKGDPMPIFGYLAIPRKGALQQLHKDLQALSRCEVISAQNREVVVLVTDTRDDEEEKALQKSLQNLNSLQSLSMTFGHGDISYNDKPGDDHETR